MQPIIIITFLILLCLSVSDWREKAIPVSHLIISCVIVCILMIVHKENSMLYYGLSVLPGAGMVGLAFLAKGKIGYADGIILSMVGALRGLLICMQSVIIALLFLLAVFIILFLFKKANRNTLLPFVPFLFIGWCITELIQAAGGTVV